MQRKILAILVTDLEGFSGLSFQTEREFIENFIKEHRKLVEEIISKHGGKIIKTLGDGFLCVFETVTSAVNAGKALQEHSIPEAPKDIKKPRLKIAIHVGEVGIDDEGDIHGDAVNLVFRLSQSVKGGCICITEEAYRISKTSEYEAIPLIPFQFKGFPHPVNIYSIPTHYKERKPLIATDDGKPAFKIAPWWRRLVSFYMDVLIFMSSLGIISGILIHPLIKVSPPLPKPGESKPVVQMETPAGKLKAYDKKLELETPVGHVEAEPGKIVVQKESKPVLELNYFHLTGIEMIIFAIYLSLFLALWKGRTPGDWLTQIRVVQQESGLPPTIFQSIIRSILLIALILPAGLGMLLPYLFSRRLVHDQLTKTIVVREIPIK
ncbi:MAG: RDD family protein [candidate division WOR-3 bacterium]